MRNADRKKLILIYQKSVEENLRYISKILKDREIFSKGFISKYNSLLKDSAEAITDKWETGDKFLRTFFVLEAFSSFYPLSYLKMSLMQDAMVNILDDLLDEILTKKEKVLYILEYLRAYSIFMSSIKDSTLFTPVSGYFNKLITLAIAEGVYLNKIRMGKNEDKMMKFAIELLDLRSLDIDVFIEIALVGSRLVEAGNLINEIGRNFRALNILKKDIKDITHDVLSNQETAVTIFNSMGRSLFKKYIFRILDHYEERKRMIFSSFKDKKSNTSVIMGNFNAMIEGEINQIKRLV